MGEVKKVIFDRSRDTVAGPDGFTRNFFQKCWKIVAEDLLRAAKAFYVGMNSLDPSLIPITYQSPKRMCQKPFQI